ncbi:riboflavin synthase [Clostridium botulinum]|uniref:riboflavin synthase n=1 Tax=Clostridium botulinum TaxID=1491 RepID=UPI00016BA767|nr:riboflavin synthase [Clostridium botulinum]AJD28815.1 riboflavin synthase, alpha subunit [Clostridium botulinum CDC_297]APU61827.1 riboflavin synthase, alpha subunit [Clostridium botulinum]EDT87136.1 riboflavin synthase, alpha subunit [Clostridium botulinum Bf]MBY6756129.1 riboflavin synthase [Clostridium botulinum]MBY6875420.1 riboflavin synthase [Clostridium botulinum]
MKAMYIRKEGVSLFTGIVEEVGRILKIEEGKDFLHISIEGSKVLNPLNIGESVAVNGVCLTVTSFNSNSFTADVMTETLNKSSLGTLSKGSLVNLERAVTLNKPLGGHIVSGHIDGTGEIINMKKEGIATLLEIKAKENLLKYMIPKGSVALDGVSLTLVDIKGKSFTVSLIPHTIEETILVNKNIGDIINIECDVLGKYIYKFMYLKKEEALKNNISLDFLSKTGFL